MGIKRHSISDKEVQDIVYEKIYPKLFDWANNIEEVDDFYKGELEEAVKWLVAWSLPSYNGFKLAKDFEDKYGLEGDEDLVECLSNMSSYVRSAISSLDEKFIKENNVVGPEIGSNVFCTLSKVSGEVIKNREDGHSLVFIPSYGHVRSGAGTHGCYIKWEDMEKTA